MPRKSLSVATRSAALHEAGYKCANPACRTVLTLDIHHLDYVSEAGADSAENLIPLCPNCHSLHHKGHIPRESLRAWKLVLLALNEGFDRRSIDILLALDKLEGVMVWGDGLLGCAALVASGLIRVEEKHEKVKMEGFLGTYKGEQVQKYWIQLSDKGHSFVAAWKQGDQSAAVSAWRGPNSNSTRPPSAAGE